MRGRGPVSYYRPRSGQRVGVVAANRSCRTRSVDCPADLISGILSLSPQPGDGISTRSRSSFPNIGCVGIAPPEPVHLRLLSSPTCARATVSQNMSQVVLSLCERASSPPSRSLRSRLRTETPRYCVLNPWGESLPWKSAGDDSPRSGGQWQAHEDTLSDGRRRGRATGPARRRRCRAHVRDLGGLDGPRRVRSPI